MHRGQLTERLGLGPRFLLFTCGALLVLVGYTLAHDKQKEAADLLTRAADTSSFEGGHQPSFRETVRFVVRAEERDAEGQYTWDYADPKTQREEMVIGGFRELWIRSNGQAWDSKQGEFDSSAITRVRTSLHRADGSS